MRTLRLRHLATVTNSNVDKNTDLAEKPVRLCNYVDVYNNDRITNDLDFMGASATHAEIAKFGLRQGDVLITKDSEDWTDIAVPAYVVETTDDLICGYHLTLLRSDPRTMRGDFLFWALQAKPVRDAFSNAAKGVTRYGLTLDGMKNVAVPCPDLDTQKAIAAFLNRETARIDRLIEKKQELASLLEEKKVSQSARLVTEGFARQSELAATGIEWLPEAPRHWRIRRIADLFREVAEPGEEGLPVLSVSINWGISDRELSDEDRHRIVNQIEDKTAYKRVRPGDIVYNMMRAWQGAFGVATIDGLVSPAYVVARPNEQLHSPFLEPLLRTPMCIEEFRRASKGIADFRQRLYWEHFRQVRVPLPPLDEQRAIAKEVERTSRAIDRVIRPVQTSIERLHEYRSALTTTAVTGQINVCSKAATITTKADRSRFRVLVGAEIVHRHRSVPRFGRVKLQKLLYLAEVHAGINEIEGRYLREAAGPLDRKLIAEAEHGMDASGFYKASAAAGEVKASTVYLPLTNAGKHREELATLLGPRTDNLDRLIDAFRDLETRSTEAVATLYAVWNDALSDGITPDDDTIIHDVLTEWHPEKQEKYKDADLRHWLAWMKRNGFIPSGNGPKTTTGRLFP